MSAADETTMNAREVGSEPRTNAVGRILRRTTGVVLIAALALGAAGCKQLVEQSVPVGGGDNIEIPNVVGMTVAEARKAIPIRSQVKLVEESGAVAGTVLTQSLKPGTRTHHDNIVLLDVAGPVEMPDVVGLDKNTAWTRLGDAGLWSVDTVWDATAAEPAGTVVAQSPEPGTATMGEGVVLTIAGPQP